MALTRTAAAATRANLCSRREGPIVLRAVDTVNMIRPRCDNPRVHDRAAVAIVAVFAVVAVAVGLHTGYRQVDVDELVYRRTLVAMHHGAGYYRAMSHALVRKEGAPPTEVRSIRPPTMFLLLYGLPASSWRWVVGIF